MLKQIFLCLVLASGLVTPASAADDKLPAILQGLKQIETSHAHFVERKTLSMLTAPLETTGTLSYTAPDRLEKIIFTPQPETLTVAGDVLTIVHDGETKTLALADYPQIAALVESVRALLSGDLPKLQSLYDVSSDGDSKSWQILLQPKDAMAKKLVSSIRLTGNGSVLREVETTEGNGDTSEMTITPDAP